MRAATWLLIVSAILVAAAAWFEPKEIEHHWDGSTSPQHDLVVARGPAIVRYDDANDTTLALYQCAHAYCSVAVKLDGNATGETRVLLARSWRQEVLSPSFENASRVVVEPFRMIPTTPLVLFAGLSVLALGVSLPLRARAPRWALAGPIVGSAFGLWAGSWSSVADLTGYLVAFLVGAVGIALLALPHTRPVGKTVALAGACAFLIIILTDGYHPACCAM